MTLTQKQNVLQLNAIIKQAIHLKGANYICNKKIYNINYNRKFYVNGEFYSRETYNKIIKKAKAQFLSLEKVEKDCIVNYYKGKINNLMANENLGIISEGGSSIIKEVLLDLGVVNNFTKRR